MPKTSQKTIILLHGFRGAPIGVAEIANYLRSHSDYQVLTPSVPPFGDSKPLEKYDASHYADFIAHYIKKHQLEKPVLAGHSMGSLITAATAEKYPDLIAQKIILLGPISTRPVKYFRILEPLALFLPNFLVSFLITTYLFVPRKNLPLFFKCLRLTYVSGKKYIDKKSVFAAIKFSADHAISNFKFKKDVLLLAGEKDRLIKSRATEKLAKEIGADCHFIKKTGHILNYENPQAVGKAILEFLD